MSEKYQLVVIGSGPGGYVAAIRAAQLGLRTALVEKKETLGGTCLNIGCIPSKALLDSSEHYFKAQNDLSVHGVNVSGVELDLDAMMKRKEKVVEQLTSGVATLMKKNKVDVVRGAGIVSKPGVVEIRNQGNEDSKTSTIEAESILLASGSVPRELPFLPFDAKTIVSSEEALSFNEVPEQMLVVGAGAIGLEMGSIWARLGSKVTIIEIMDSAPPGWDLQLSRTLKRYLKEIGIDLRLSTKVTGYTSKKKGLELAAENKKGEEEKFEGNVVLIAVGRKPYLAQDVSELGVELDGERVKVNERFETTLPGIYAIGDLIHGPMLAHKAEEEAVACVENIAGKSGHMRYDTIPNIVYTWPEVASVGSTEEELKENGTEYEKGVFQFRANGRALAAEDSAGFVKILSDPDNQKILGAHILGPWASTLISEIVTTMEFGGSAEDIGRIIHAHPTLTEAVKEAALASYGASIHSA